MILLLNWLGQIQGFTKFVTVNHNTVKLIYFVLSESHMNVSIIWRQNVLRRKGVFLLKKTL